MAGSPLLSIFGVLNKLQERVASTASSSRPFDSPKLKKLNDMVYEVYRPPLEEKAELEIVFFHGLQVRRSEDAYVTTWMTRDNSEVWLQAWLVESFPKARIFTISYDSSAKKTPESGRLDMYCTAENLVSSLTADDIRIGQAGCPVVLVGHCLGGLVLKELCLTAAWMVGRKSDEKSGVQRVDDLFSNLRGMFFYGTPHTGSFIGDELHKYFKGELLEEMKTMKASSARRNQEFDDLKSKYGWLTSGIGELHETYVECLGRYIHMVPEASTRPYMDNYYTAAADHYDICKPQGKNDSAFVHLRDFLIKIQNDGVVQALPIAMAERFIDLEGRANQVRSILDRPDTSTIFIVGLSGIGKTSLAQQVFYDIRHTFSVALFVSLDSTVDAPSKSNCRERVLRKMQDAFEEVNRSSNHNHSDVLPHLKGRRVLLVLDNVEFEDELKALRTETWLEGSASKIIITTTNSRLGTPSNTFPVPYLSSKESEQLFRRYAFKAAEEAEDLRHLVSAVIEECENFPLSLKIVGGFIGNEDVHDKQLWLDLLDRLQKAQEIDSHPDYKHLAKLRLCYEALPPSEQEIYLDVATLFHGAPFDMVKCIWSGAWESSHLAWKNLERRFLVEVDREGRIWMHRLLRNLGQSVACPPNKSIERWTRILTSSCAKELIAKHQVMHCQKVVSALEICGFSLQEFKSSDWVLDHLIHDKAKFNCNLFKLSDSNLMQGVVNTLGLRLEVMKKEILTLRNTTFLKYKHLKYLILKGVRTSRGTLALPKSLVYLRWTDGLFTVCPIDFTGLEKLVALELVDCRSMKVLPPSVVKASKLIWLELGGCLSLAALPLGLSRFLEHLGLNKTSLKNLPSDLGKLQRLTHLQANGTQLTKIPQGLGLLEMLSSLNLSGTRLTSLPESVGDLNRLKNLNLRGTMVTCLPDSIGRLQELKVLALGHTKLGSLPESIGGLRRLEELDLSRTCVKSLPQSLGDLDHLQSLQCWSTPLETLPDSICELHHLLILDLQDTQITGLPDATGELVALKSLYLTSPRLRGWWKTTGRSSQITWLIVELGQLCDKPALFLEPGEVDGRGEENALDVRDGESQMGIHSFLSQLPLLHAVSELHLHGSGFPQYWLQPLFLALQRMPSLTTLYLVDFDLVEVIPCELGTLTKLEVLSIVGFKTLRELPESLGELTRLETLHLWEMPELGRLPESLSALPSLSSVDIGRCPSLQSVPRSFSCMSPLESEASTSHSRNCGRLDSVKAICIHTEYSVQCKGMEKMRKEVIKKGGEFVLDRKVAREILTKAGLHFLGDDYRQPDGSRHCSFTSSCRCRVPTHSSSIYCNKMRCVVHRRSVTVSGGHEASDRIEDEDSVMEPHAKVDKDSEDEENEVLLIKYLHALLSCLLCSR